MWEKLHDLDFMLTLFVGVFWAIVFLQSGLDKVVDWKGNLSWLKSHFEKSPLGAFVPLLLGVLTLIEILAGAISLIGVFMHLIQGHSMWIQQGVVLSCIALLMLIFGQRLAKDYDGAKTIAIYFGVALLSGLILM